MIFRELVFIISRIPTYWTNKKGPKMAEYNLGFSQQLLNAADLVCSEELDDLEAKRTILYLSLLACEITLKSVLEKVGIPIKEIKKLSHDLTALLGEFSKLEFNKEVGNGKLNWVNGAAIRSCTVDDHFGNATIGTLLTGEQEGASIYPNQIRYGNDLKHFPPEMMLEAAKILYVWVSEHFRTIRIICV